MAILWRSLTGRFWTSQNSGVSRGLKDFSLQQQWCQRYFGMEDESMVQDGLITERIGISEGVVRACTREVEIKLKGWRFSKEVGGKEEDGRKRPFIPHFTKQSYPSKSSLSVSRFSFLNCSSNFLLISMLLCL